MDRNSVIQVSKPIIVAGDVMLDHYWKGESTRLSPEAPVPVVRVDDQEPRLGGAANVALNLAKLGVEPVLCGIIGNDPAGGVIRQIAQSAGIVSPLVTSSIRTTEKIRILAQNQQIVRVDFEEWPIPVAVREFNNCVSKLIPNSQAIIFSDYNKGSLENVQHLIQLAREFGVITLIDPKGTDYSKYRGASVITPNCSELAAVVGKWTSESDLVNRAMTLRKELGLEKLLLTRSEDGMTLFEEDAITNFKAQALEVFDVSGAGDTAIAVLACMLSEGKGWHDAVKIANKAAGIVVGRLGTSSITREDLNNVID